MIFDMQFAAVSEGIVVFPDFPFGVGATPQSDVLETVYIQAVNSPNANILGDVS